MKYCSVIDNPILYNSIIGIIMLLVDIYYLFNDIFDIL